MNIKNLTEKDKIIFIKLKKKDAQLFIQFIKDKFKNASIIDRRYKIEHKGNYILFPLVKNKEMVNKLVGRIESCIHFEFLSKKGINNQNFKYRTLEEALRDKIPSNYIGFIPRSYDIVGNLAILDFEKPDQINIRNFNKFKNLVAKAVIDVNKNVDSVFEKKSEIKGSYRLRDLHYLMGENNTKTIHKENGCLFHIDLKRAYFSPRLVYERKRVSESNIRENEVIVDMFAGVGPFSIQIAKLNQVEIHAFDLNPAACNFLKENIATNKLIGTIFPYNIDIKEVVNPSNQIGKVLRNNVDRIIMNLPETSIDFIDVACFLMRKTGGIVHFYKFSEKPSAIEETINALGKRLKKESWRLGTILNSKTVKSYSPNTELIVIDLTIKHS